MNAYVVTCLMSAFTDEVADYKDRKILGAFGTRSRAMTFILGIDAVEVEFPIATKVKILASSDITLKDAVRIGRGLDEETEWYFEFNIEKVPVK